MKMCKFKIRVSFHIFQFLKKYYQLKNIIYKPNYAMAIYSFANLPIVSLAH